ncbi:MAG TPA: DUF302 domain-containing protein [Actinomycetota bacterium]|jgi:uncharacterized protein (DUF302 family)|nr:DUF302 domain-containing protein [Actinomycetota bacterium]
MSDYGYSVLVDEGYDEAVVRARLALRGEGFSIITEMHVGGVLGPEAGAERQYLFMGAWNSREIEQLDGDIRVAMHIPCNVVVQEQGSTAYVAALDPVDALEEEGVSVPPAAAVAARDALGRALRRVAAPA